MRRQYFVHYYKRFANAYNLFYADTEEDLKLVPEDAERITRKKAESLAADENYRRRTDRSFSGFADNAVYPVGMTERDIYNLEQEIGFHKVGYVWERN